MTTGHGQNLEQLGRGRSGVVYKVPDGRGGFVADKVFTGEPLAKTVLYVLTGAPNPYVWNEDAIRCAVLRRQILADLVRVWFPDGALRVANALAWRWNEEHRAFGLRATFVPGRPASLHHPLSAERDDELRDLIERVMEPLQAHLIESGFDGLVWQAGRGNPVATNNFLLEAAGDRRVWTWIDLESGVPALFPSNPRALLEFYVPKSIAHGRPLFDDVDVPRLRDWLEREADGLEVALGAETVVDLHARVDELERHQTAWRSMRRGHRSIAYALGKGRITEKQAAWYRRNVPVWYGRLLLRAPGEAFAGLGRLARRAWRFVRGISLRRLARGLWLAMTSQRYRVALAHRYIGHRINVWADRRQLTTEQARYLHANLESEESGAYLADFGMHLAIKPFVKIAQWWIIAPGIATGVVDPFLGAFLIITGGMLGRTAYSLYRVGEASVRGRERPWVALGVGLLPVLGNVAFPMQVIYSGTSHQARLAQFIVYNTTTRLGELVPIWGGADTRTEHLFNRVGDLFTRHRAGTLADDLPDEAKTAGAA